MIYVFLADGFEECEALIPIDILRRGGIDVKTVGITSKSVMGAHNIEIICDITQNQADFDGLEGIILPGGMPGTINLEKSKVVQNFIDFSAQNGLLICAICAAPSILGHKGLLNGKKATCFPGFEKDLLGAEISDLPVIKDGNIITALGAGAAFDFGFEILRALTNNETKINLAKQMHYIK